VTEELVWAYCVAGEPPGVSGEGIDGRPLERVEAGGLAALVSHVPRSEFAEDALRRNLNDLDWLARVARAHEHVLEHVLSETTIVPLRLCTLFESEDGVRRMLEEEHQALSTALSALHGRDEWGVKLILNKATLEDAIFETSPEAAAMRAEMEGKSEGAAYLIRRRLERHVRDSADALAAAAADELRAELDRCVLGLVTRPAQNPELSGHSGTMMLNAACLIERGGAERLHKVGGAFETRYAHLGARVELTGPWPPYNFVPDSKS
jgi:Gas vesicle synthesis protein GvpL/GvpF